MRPKNADDRDSLVNRAFATTACSQWADHASVKREEFAIAPLLDATRPDFVEELLPFRAHPAYVGASEEWKQRALSCGWLIYNEKVVRVETDVVSPTCNDVIAGVFKGADDGASRESMAQALVDEAYHILIVCRACRITRQQRSLESVRIPQMKMVTALRALEDASAADRWKVNVLQALGAIAVETAISKYLSLLSNAHEIQPLNRVTTAVHRRDEAAHAGLFVSIAKSLYGGLDREQRAFFERMLPLPWIWFASGEFEIWESVLDQIGFPGGTAMVRECQAERHPEVYDRALADATAFAADLEICSSAWPELVAEAMRIDEAAVQRHRSLQP